MGKNLDRTLFKSVWELFQAYRQGITQANINAFAEDAKALCRAFKETELKQISLDMANAVTDYLLALRGEEWA